MRFTKALFALAVTGLASAQIPNVPSCSLQCFLESLTNDGCSELTDFACHCTKPQLPQEITPCVEKACSEADQSAVSSAVIQECSAAGQPISLPPVGGSNAGRSEVTATASPASSSAVSGTPSSIIASSSAAVTGSSSSGVIPSASASSSYSGSAKPPAFTGAASNMKCSLAGAAAVAAAAVYAV